MTTRITGASDDLIELEGDIYDEFDSYDTDSKLKFDTGAVLVLHYDEEGVWRITDRSTREGLVASIVRCENRPGYTGPDGKVYSDEATIEGATSVKHSKASA